MSVTQSIVAAVNARSTTAEVAQKNLEGLLASGTIQVGEFCQAVQEIARIKAVSEVKQGSEWGEIGLGHSDNGNIQFTNCGMSHKWRNLNVRPGKVYKLVAFIRSAEFDGLLAKEMAAPAVLQALAESNLPTEQKKALAAERAAAAANRGKGVASAPANVTPNGPAFLYDPTTKQCVFYLDSKEAYSDKGVSAGRWLGRCEVVTSSSPEWNSCRGTMPMDRVTALAKL